MNILVVNGSPKGKSSITVQTLLYLEIKHPEHHFTYIEAAQKIKMYEKDFSEAREKLEEADVIIFSYPVYTFLVPSQLHKFIELIKINGINLKGKTATQFSTSKHFYDVTAHKFIRENCNDLNLNYVKGLSADMEDLTKNEGQKQAQDFFDYLIWSIENSVFENNSLKTKEEVLPLRMNSDIKKLSEISQEINTERDIVILTDAVPADKNLLQMIEIFKLKSGVSCRVINLNDFNFAGGCLGCLNCATSGKCIYKDGFETFLRGEIQSASSIVYAFKIKDHSMGSLFKMYDDRQFCNGHRTVTMGLPYGYLISGNFNCEENLRTVIEARAETGGNFLAGIACDEEGKKICIKQIDDLAKKINFALEKKYCPPKNFYGVGGIKIFRDLIWIMQGLMTEDYKFFKAHGQLDFPQKKRGTMLLMKLVGAMFRNKKMKTFMQGKMSEGMLMPYTKVLNKAKKEGK